MAVRDHTNHVLARRNETLNSLPKHVPKEAIQRARIQPFLYKTFVLGGYAETLAQESVSNLERELKLESYSKDKQSSKRKNTDKYVPKSRDRSRGSQDVMDPPPFKIPRLDKPHDSDA